MDDLYSTFKPGESISLSQYSIEPNDGGVNEK